MQQISKDDCKLNCPKEFTFQASNRMLIQLPTQATSVCHQHDGSTEQTIKESGCRSTQSFPNERDRQYQKDEIGQLSTQTSQSQAEIKPIVQIPHSVNSQLIVGKVTKFIKHCSQMSIADKYIRMITAMIKTYRAFQSQNNLQRCYKELVMTRRVIRMQGKYETIIELIQNDDSTFMKLFKVMQLLGEFADLGAFWTEIIAQTGSRLGKISQRLQKIEANFYFAECLIWLIYYSYQLLQINRNQKNGQKNNRKSHILKLKISKYVMDTITSYNNSSIKRIAINPKVGGILNIFSSLIGLYLLWV